MAISMKQQLQNAAAGVKFDAANQHVSKPPQANPSYKAAGRLGDPTMEPHNDPRINPKLLERIAPMGLDHFSAPPGLEKLSADATMEDLAAFNEGFEHGIMQLYNNIPLDLPEDQHEIKIERTEQTIPGGDGQPMIVYIYRPATQGQTKLPAVQYHHGGGMAILTTQNPVHDRWCRSLAANGVVVIMPDFRNAFTPKKLNPFPAGLNDCAAAAKWSTGNRDELRIRNLVVQGESGGGNLTLAVALKAKREGWADQLAGVYALCPAISNLFGVPEDQKLRELPSLVENHGYFLNAHVLAFNSYFYTPNEADATNPLAWPYHATRGDMAGLPPHVLVMDELDALRDEGIAYGQRLAHASVPVKASVNMGTLHGASLMFRQTLPQLHKGVARDIAAFAKEL